MALFAAYHQAGAVTQTFAVPADMTHTHLWFNGWYYNVPVTPGETISVRIGLPPSGPVGGWPDGGNAGADLPVSPGGTFHARGGYGSTCLINGAGQVFACLGGSGGPGSGLNDNDHAAPPVTAPSSLPGIGDPPRAPSPDAFGFGPPTSAPYVAPQFPYDGLPAIFHWTPGRAGGTFRGANGIVDADPSTGQPVATSGGGGGWGGGASGGYEVTFLHTDPLHDGTGTGGSNLITNQTFGSLSGGTLYPATDGGLPPPTSDEATAGDLLVSQAEADAFAAGDPLARVVAFYWPATPADEWRVGVIGSINDVVGGLF